LQQHLFFTFFYEADQLSRITHFKKI
jgi:hypothetical protein